MKTFNLHRFFLLFACLAVAGLVSCSSSLTVTAKSTDGVTLNFNSSFSKEAQTALLSLTGAQDSSTNAPLINAGDVKSFLLSSQATNVKALVSPQNEITASGEFAPLSQKKLSELNILKRTDTSLSLSLGPEQITAFYNSLPEDTRSYFDLLMIPCLNDDQMDINEYTQLLASVYGTTLAQEIANGQIKIELNAENLKKTVKAQITLGELFTLTEQKTWSVSW